MLNVPDPPYWHARARKLYDEGKSLPEIIEVCRITRHQLAGVKRRQAWPVREQDVIEFKKRFPNGVRQGAKPRRQQQEAGKRGYERGTSAPQ